MLFKGLPREQIETLKPGDFFVDGPVVSLQKQKHTPTCTEYRYVVINTMAGSRCIAHLKFNAYNVFKRKRKTENEESP
jgi:hypothetical protein